jgi:hypothetical protein
VLSDVGYVLPIKVDTAVAATSDLARYVGWLSRRMQVVVADGSPPSVFGRNAEAWPSSVRHVALTSTTLNGKVAGVCDGVAAAGTALVVVADDDVRYTLEGLERVVASLDRHDAVMPQNYFDPAPWHARWDTGRSLLNRCFGADYAGTIALRRSALLATRGYCGGVLFENLELMRTLAAHGYDVVQDRTIYVARRPPALRQFAHQRIRQAYDSRAQPRRRAAELALLPLGVVLARRPRLLAAAAGVAVAAAEVGRRRGAGSAVWPAASAGWVLPWLAERSVTAWIAEAAYWRGGARYRGRRLRTAAHREAELAAGRGCPDPGCGCRLDLRAGTGDANPAPSITVCSAGPYLVRGAAAVVDGDREFEPARPVVGICRCDRSSVKPWCDGTHKLLPAGWEPRRTVEDVGGGRLRVVVQAARGRLSPASTPSEPRPRGPGKSRVAG